MEIEMEIQNEEDKRGQKSTELYLRDSAPTNGRVAAAYGDSSSDERNQKGQTNDTSDKQKCSTYNSSSGDLLPPAFARSALLQLLHFNQLLL